MPSVKKGRILSYRLKLGEVFENAVFLFATFISMFITGGIPYSIGIYNLEWLEHYHNSSGLTAWLGSMNIAIMLCCGPVSGILVKKLGYRKVIFVGGILTSVGLIGSAYATSLYVLFFTYGTLTGVGFGLAHVPTMAILAESSEKTRTVFTGIATSAVSLGMFTLPMYANVSIDAYGWRGSMIILSGLSLHLSVAGLLLNRPRSCDEHNIEFDYGNDVAILGSLTSLNLSKKMMHLEIFKQKLFILMIVHAFFVSCGYLIAYIHITSAATELFHLNHNEARLTISVMGIANLIARLLIGTATRHRKVNLLNLYLILTLTAGTLLIVLPHSGNYTGLLCTASGIGFSFAAYGCFLPCLIAEYVKHEYIAVACGYMMCSCGLGYLVGPPLAGWLYDYSKNYANSLYMGASFVFVSIIIMTPSWVDICKGMCCTTSSNVENTYEAKTQEYGLIEALVADDPDRSSFIRNNTVKT